MRSSTALRPTDTFSRPRDHHGLGTISTVPPSWGSNEIPSRAEIAAALLCPFPRLMNRHVHRAQESSVNWLRRMYGDGLSVRRAAKAGIASMAASFFPEAAPYELSLGADYLSWIFALDDVGDETPIGQRPGALAELLQQFDDVFHGRATAGNADASVHALHDILERLSDIATADELKRFHEANQVYWGGMLWEANNRAHRQVPDEDVFLRMRPAAGAVFPVAVLAEPLDAIHLTLESPTLEEVAGLGHLAGRIMCWLNDVLSFEKERLHGDVHNLAIVYEVHRQLPVGAALREAIRFCNAETDEFMARVEGLPHQTMHDTAVRRYVRVLKSMIRVTLDWTLESVRYGGAASSASAALR